MRIPTLTALCNMAVQLTRTEEGDKYPFGYRSVGLHGGQCYRGSIDWNIFDREQYIDAAKAAIPGLDDERSRALFALVV